TNNRELESRKDKRQTATSRRQERRSSFFLPPAFQIRNPHSAIVRFAAERRLATRCRSSRSGTAACCCVVGRHRLARWWCRQAASEVMVARTYRCRYLWQTTHCSHSCLSHRSLMRSACACAKESLTQAATESTLRALTPANLIRSG